MEISEIVFALMLGLVGTISLISAWVVKANYKTEASEIKAMITEQSKKIDQIWKHMRIDK